MRGRLISVALCVAVLQSAWAQSPGSAARNGKKGASVKGAAAVPVAAEALEPLPHLPPPPPAPEPLVMEAPAPPSAVQQVSIPAALPVAAPARFHLVPSLGFGMASESEVSDTATTFSAGVELGYDFTEDFSLHLSGSFLSSSRTYLAFQLDPSRQQGSRAEVLEQRVGGDLLVSYELLRVLGVKEPRVRLALIGGPSTRFFLNDAFRSMAGGIGVGGRARWAFSDRLDVTVSGLWTYNFFFKNQDLASVLGGPRSVSSLSGSLGLHLSPQTRLGLGYSGEILTLVHSYRSYHSIAFVFDLAL